MIAQGCLAAVAQEQGLPTGHQRIAHDQLELLEGVGRHLPFVDAHVSLGVDGQGNGAQRPGG